MVDSARLENLFIAAETKVGSGQPLYPTIDTIQYQSSK